MGGGMHSRDWSWRVSIADIIRNGPFSTFPGMDRHLTLIEGRGIVLRGVNGSMRLACIGDCVAFPGEETLNVETIDGPVRVWNVMTRRGVVDSLTRVDRGESPGCSMRESECEVAVVLDGVYSMRRGDAPFRIGEGFCSYGASAPYALQPTSLRDVVLRTEIRAATVTQL
jgi:environmental stress-induced protein Ves